MVVNQNWTLMLRTMVMKPTKQVTTCEGLEQILIPWPILDFTTVGNLKEITKKLQSHTLVTVQSDAFDDKNIVPALLEVKYEWRPQQREN